MYNNFLKATLRSLWKNRTYSFLNIFGLSIGIACAGLIFLWVEDEINFDSVHLKKDRLYAVRENQLYDAGTFTHWSTPGVLGPSLKTEIPGIANACRTSEGGETLLFTIGERSVYASGKYAEPSLFSMFTLPFVQGNAATAFKQLHSIVITEKTAKNFFGDDKKVIGKTVRIDNKQDYVVTGILKDIPANSSLQFDWVAPFEPYFQQRSWLHKWENNSITTYVELDGAANITAINKQLHNYIQQRIPTSITRLFLFGMTDWRLYDDFDNGKQTGGGRIEYVRLFSIIAWIILLIACINFMNLATARSEKRAREVGVRKVLGAGKKSLVAQFISEALFMAFIAAVVAVVMISLFIPAFNLLVQKTLSPGLDSPVHIAALVLVTVICGLVAGSYPSFYLSSFNPAAVLKGVKIKTGSAGSIRKGLVVFQFSISIVLIISTIIVYQQIQHVKNRSLGFDKNNLIEMDVQGEMGSHFAVIRQDLLNTGLVENVAVSDHSTIYDGNNTGGLTWEGKNTSQEILISARYVSPEFFETSGIKLLEGRNLRPADTSNTATSVVVTASLAKLMDRESALGKTIHEKGDTMMATVVGVVNDYVYGNMYGKPDPVIFFCIPPQLTTKMYVRTKPRSDPEETLAKLAVVMKKNNPAYPFQYRFVDDQFNQMFLSEMLMSKLSRVFAALAIFISCLGLFGLAAYTAERRTKEIGIRKVLGASVRGIAGLISKDFLQLVVISCIIAFPISWLIMNGWLQDYDYRIKISPWVFVLAGVVALVISLLTISFQAIKAAVANPVNSLRTE